MSEPAGDGPLVVLVGLPGSGKTTVGRKLARRLGVEFEDTDHLVERRTGRSIPEIFATDGEAGFRRLEEQTVAEALHDHRGVLSLGGGAVLSAATRALLRGRRVVHLTIGIAEGARRSQGPSRPLLSGPDPVARYQALHTDRGPLYREVAWYATTTERRSSGKVVSELVDRVRAEAPDVVPPEGAEPAGTADDADD